MPRAMWMPRRRLVSIVLVSASLGAVIGVAGTLVLVPRPASGPMIAAGHAADQIGDTLPGITVAQRFDPAASSPGGVDVASSSRQPSRDCKEGTWPYFDRHCLWAASKKQGRARPVAAPYAAAAASTAMSVSGVLVSATSVPAAASSSRQAVSTSNDSRPVTRKTNASQNTAAQKIAPLDAYDSYAAFPRAAVGGFPLLLPPRFMHD